MGILCALKYVCSLDVQIVTLLLESGVDINLRNYRGQVERISKPVSIELVRDRRHSYTYISVSALLILCRLL